MQNQPTSLGWIHRSLSESLSPNEKKRLHFLADFWCQSKSDFRSQRKSQQKSNSKSELTHVLCIMANIYRSPNSTQADDIKLCNDLECLVADVKKDIIIVGDFNF